MLSPVNLRFSDSKAYNYCMSTNSKLLSGTCYIRTIFALIKIQSINSPTIGTHEALSIQWN